LGDYVENNHSEHSGLRLKLKINRRDPRCATLNFILILILSLSLVLNLNLNLSLSLILNLNLILSLSLLLNLNLHLNLTDSSPAKTVIKRQKAAIAARGLGSLPKGY
jgi:hypothetical protein